MTTRPSTSSGNLPIPIQLTGLTALVFFCLSAIDVYNLSRVLWINQEMIASLDAGNLIQLGMPLAFSLVACVVSVLAFVSLVFRSSRRAALISICYLFFLLALLVVRLIGFVLIQSVRPLPPNFLAFAVGLRLLYGAWFIGLLVKVWPHYVANAALSRVRPSEPK